LISLLSARITDAPAAHDFVRFKPGFGRRFILTVDTEEEFDWDSPLRASGHTLHSVSRLAKFQQFCEGFGIVPIYLIDYPVATSRLAIDILHEPVNAGRAEVGVQLHPWVSPPFEEEVNQLNSFAGNLSPELERAKFTMLRDTIERNFGQSPRIYRAGRYGVGSNTAQILRDLGIALDTSARARFDYSANGGPNFRDLPVRPWWIGGPGALMETPLTTVYWGPLKRWGHWLYPKLWRTPRLRGALARIGLLERIPFTPEGVTEVALADDLPLLVFSFHSPSLQPGHTPYVRNEDELDALYDWWRRVFTVLASAGVRPTSVAEIMSSTELA
jgi:hypothetical protein